MSRDWTTHHSAIDSSVNHILTTSEGIIECRFVQRHEDYIVCYLSSHTGCNLSCRFCHLTATGQTNATPVTIQQYLEQADRVLGTYLGLLQRGHRSAKTVHFNFMARGEALANPFFLEHSSELFSLLRIKADVLGLHSKFLVSTILPETFATDLSTLLWDSDSIPYYSLYSINPTFRKRWLPKAMDPEKALSLLKIFQDETAREIVLHWAFIEGQNDDIADIDQMLDLIEKAGIMARFNLVRYNPHDGRHGVETEESKLRMLFNRIEKRMMLPGSKIIERVGRDVFASCGTFINPNL